MSIYDNLCTEAFNACMASLAWLKKDEDSPELTAAYIETVRDELIQYANGLIDQEAFLNNIAVKFFSAKTQKSSQPVQASPAVASSASLLESKSLSAGASVAASFSTVLTLGAPPTHHLTQAEPVSASSTRVTQPDGVAAVSRKTKKQTFKPPSHSHSKAAANPAPETISSMLDKDQHGIFEQLSQRYNQHLEKKSESALSVHRTH